MKKTQKEIMIIVTSLLVLVAIFAWRPFSSQSSKITRQIGDVLAEAKQSDRPYLFVKGDINRLQFRRAKAYIAEKRPDDAIAELIDLIREHQEPLQNVYGQERPRIAADWYFEARFYDALAQAYEQKGDKIARDKAIKKAERARAIEAKLRPAEDARAKRREQRERSAVLD